MTDHDPRVTLTEAEVERLCDALEDCDAEYRVEQRVAREVESIIAARLAPLERWKAEAMPVMDGLQELGAALDLPLGTRITGRAALDAVLDLRNALRAALSAHESASQDHDGTHGPPRDQQALRSPTATASHVPRRRAGGPVTASQGHDEAEGQGEGR